MPDTVGVSEHVYYEIDMLFRTGGLLRKLKGTTRIGKLLRRLKGRSPYHDPVLESFAVHARNVIEFLFFKQKGDYARAEHFFPDPERWRGIVHGHVGKYGRVLQQASEQIAHLTYARVGANKDWYPVLLVEDLRPHVRRFLDEADESLMGPELRQLKKVFPA